MTRKLPLVPTILVAGAVAVMIGLGVWQLQRAKWKEGLLRQALFFQFNFSFSQRLVIITHSESRLLVKGGK